MTVPEIIKELKFFPSLIYVYDKLDEWGTKSVILGGQPCAKKDEHDSIKIEVAKKHNCRMQEAFNKEELEEADKYSLVREFKYIRNLCNYRDSRLYSLNQQEEYLRGLDEEALEQIAEQIEMYKFVRSIYKYYK